MILLSALQSEDLGSTWVFVTYRGEGREGLKDGRGVWNETTNEAE